jgi:hypothetical protein
VDLSPPSGKYPRNRASFSGGFFVTAELEYMDHGQADYLRALQAVVLEDVDASSKLWLTYFRDNLLANVIDAAVSSYQDAVEHFHAELSLAEESRKRGSRDDLLASYLRSYRVVDWYGEQIVGRAVDVLFAPFTSLVPERKHLRAAFNRSRTGRASKMLLQVLSAARAFVLRQVRLIVFARNRSSRRLLHREALSPHRGWQGTHHSLAPHPSERSRFFEVRAYQ